MKRYEAGELEAYGAGIRAAWRQGEYEGCEDVPDNPYPPKIPENDAWEDGFADGTDDLISWQRSE